MHSPEPSHHSNKPLSLSATISSSPRSSSSSNASSSAAHNTQSVSSLSSSTSALSPPAASLDPSSPQSQATPADAHTRSRSPREHSADHDSRASSPRQEYSTNSEGVWTPQTEISFFEAIGQCSPIGANMFLSALNASLYIQSKHANCMWATPEAVVYHLQELYDLDTVAQDERDLDLTTARDFSLPSSDPDLADIMRDRHKDRSGTASKRSAPAYEAPTPPSSPRHYAVYLPPHSVPVHTPLTPAPPHAPSSRSSSSKNKRTEGNSSSTSKNPSPPRSSQKEAKAPIKHTHIKEEKDLKSNGEFKSKSVNTDTSNNSRTIDSSKTNESDQTHSKHRDKDEERYKDKDKDKDKDRDRSRYRSKYSDHIKQEQQDSVSDQEGDADPVQYSDNSNDATFPDIEETDSNSSVGGGSRGGEGTPLPGDGEESDESDLRDVRGTLQPGEKYLTFSEMMYDGLSVLGSSASLHTLYDFARAHAADIDERFSSRFEVGKHLYKSNVRSTLHNNQSLFQKKHNGSWAIVPGSLNPRHMRKHDARKE